MTTTAPSTSHSPRTHQVVDQSGNVLFVRDWGPVDGEPVICHHGTPESSLHIPGGWEAPEQLGIRVITFDRPGYGNSTPVRGRRVADAATWTRRIADTLHLDDITLFGASGGAPHAAASAALLGERIRKLCLSAGVGPDEMPGFDPAADMLAQTRHEIACARAGEATLRAFLTSLTDKADPLDEWFKALPASDVEVMSRGDVRAEGKASQSQAHLQGIEGWVEDDLALFHRDWACDLSAVTAETLLLYGVDDVLVPSSHGDAYRAVLGHGQLLKLPNAGHCLRDYEGEVLTWLASRTPGPARLSD